MTNTRSADDLIISEENKKLGIQAEETSHPAVNTENSPTETSQKEQTVSEATSSETVSSSETPSRDDYGNPVESEKTYTEAEVQAMIRKRLRNRHDEAAQPESTTATPAAEGERDWQDELGDFVEKKFDEISTRRQREEWQKREVISQQQFEEKFTTGMTKYNDFENVVRDKPITASMMIAARSMEDPAGFLYAACKQHPAEVERIARMEDGYAQIAEMARLDERMRKSRQVPNTAKPMPRYSGDATSESPKRSSNHIDQLINEHAKSKIVYRDNGRR